MMSELAVSCGTRSRYAPEMLKLKWMNSAEGYKKSTTTGSWIMSLASQRMSHAFSCQSKSPVVAQSRQENGRIVSELTVYEERAHHDGQVLCVSVRLAADALD